MKKFLFFLVLFSIKISLSQELSWHRPFLNNNSYNFHNFSLITTEKSINIENNALIIRNTDGIEIESFAYSQPSTIIKGVSGNETLGEYFVWGVFETTENFSFNTVSYSVEQSTISTPIWFYARYNSSNELISFNKILEISNQAFWIKDIQQSDEGKFVVLGSEATEFYHYNYYESPTDYDSTNHYIIGSSDMYSCPFYICGNNEERLIGYISVKLTDDIIGFSVSNNSETFAISYSWWPDENVTVVDQAFYSISDSIVAINGSYSSSCVATFDLETGVLIGHQEFDPNYDYLYQIRDIDFGQNDLLYFSGTSQYKGELTTIEDQVLTIDPQHEYDYLAGYFDICWGVLKVNSNITSLTEPFGIKYLSVLPNNYTSNNQYYSRIKIFNNQIYISNNFGIPVDIDPTINESFQVASGNGESTLRILNFDPISNEESLVSSLTPGGSSYDIIYSFIISDNGNIFLHHSGENAEINPNGSTVIASGNVFAKYNLSSSLGINQKSPIQEILVFPNPTENYFQISTENDIQSIDIYNINGQKLIEFEASPNYNIASFPAGLYWIKINSNDGNAMFKINKN